jgi:hypothetical protein
MVSQKDPARQVPTIFTTLLSRAHVGGGEEVLGRGEVSRARPSL